MSWVDTIKTKKDAVCIITELEKLDNLIGNTSKEIKMLKIKFNIGE